MIAALTLAAAIDDDVSDAPHVVAGRAQRFDAENALKLLSIDDGCWNACLLILGLIVVLRGGRGGARLRRLRGCVRLRGRRGGGQRRRRRRLSRAPRWRFRIVSCGYRRVLRCEQCKSNEDSRLLLHTAPAAKAAPRRGGKRRHGLASLPLIPAMMTDTLRRRTRGSSTSPQSSDRVMSILGPGGMDASHWSFGFMSCVIDSIWRKSA